MANTDQFSASSSCFNPHEKYRCGKSAVFCSRRNQSCFTLVPSCFVSGAGTMEADDRQEMTVFTVQPSFHHWHSTNEYHEALPSSTNVQSHLTSSLADDVTLHDYHFVESRWWNDGWTVKTVVTWRSSASMIPAPDVGNEGCFAPVVISHALLQLHCACIAGFRHTCACCLWSTEHAGAAGGTSQWGGHGEGAQLHLPAVQSHAVVPCQWHHPPR